MTDEILAKFKKEASRLTLKKEEKFSIRQNLMLIMRDNPVRNENIIRHNMQGSKLRFNFLSLKLLTNPMPLILIVALLVGGGVSFAAEGALPGDILYPVKVDVNEEVRAMVTYSSEAKADWEAQRAERRLEEAEQLASEGNLDADTSIKIEDNFVAHADKVHNRIEEFKNNNNFKAAADVSSNFEASLKVHHKILDKLSGKESEIDFLNEKVKLETEDMAGVRSDAQSKVRATAKDGGSFEDTGQNNLKTDGDISRDASTSEQIDGGNDNNESDGKTGVDAGADSEGDSIKLHEELKTNLGL